MLHACQVYATNEYTYPGAVISEMAMAVVQQVPLRPPRQRMRISLSDQKFLGLLWQVLVVGAAAALLIWLWANAVDNLNVWPFATGFGFLSKEAGMPITNPWIANNPKDTFLRALAAGVANTLRVPLVGIVLATALGTRLSKNWLIAK